MQCKKNFVQHQLDIYSFHVLKTVDSDQLASKEAIQDSHCIMFMISGGFFRFNSTKSVKKFTWVFISNL